MHPADDPRHQRCRPHLRRHFCAVGVNRRRREHAEFTALLDDPREMVEPSTFELSADELKSHANSLVLDYGFSVDEVIQVLDIEPAGATR